MSGASVEKRLVALESMIKEAKAVYPVAASLVPYVVSESGEYTLTATAQSTSTIRVRFTMNGSSATGLIALTAITTSGTRLPCNYITEPSSGDGSAVVKIWLAGSYNQSTTATVKVLAAAPVGGAFTQL